MMGMGGRIEGRKSEDGSQYVISQGNNVLRSIPMAEALGDAKLAAAIRQNKWKPLEE